jgi:hypothetical protein
MKQSGKSVMTSLTSSKAFKNPDMLEKLISFCKIDEIGTNYPPALFNTKDFLPSDFYDELGNRFRNCC